MYYITLINYPAAAATIAPGKRTHCRICMENISVLQLRIIYLWYSTNSVCSNCPIK